MRYNWYLYWLPVQAVPIIDIVKNSISSADIVTDPIIGTSLIKRHMYQSQPSGSSKETLTFDASSALQLWLATFANGTILTEV